MTVTVEYVIREEVIDVNDVMGGLRICVDDESIVKVVREEDLDSRYEWKPQYVGQYINSEFQKLVNKARNVANGKRSIYQYEIIRFSPSKVYFIVEPLSECDLRIAYRIDQSELTVDDPVLAAPESACGYVVDRCEFCHAVSDAAHEYAAELRSMPLEWGFDLLDAFETSLAELDEALETCNQTPPQFTVNE